MEKKRRTLDQLSDAGQDAAALLRSPKAGAKIEADTEELTHRWDNLVQKLEDCSFQVCACSISIFHTSLKRNRSSQIPLHFLIKVMEAVTDAGVTQVDEQVAMETAVAGVADQELTPPAPPKKRLVEMDPEVKTK